MTNRLSIDKVFAVALSLTSLFWLFACATPANDSASVSFIALGDAGLHHDWYDPEDVGFTREELIAMERADWIEDGKRIEDFVMPPLRTIPGTDYVVEQSGQEAVADAMASYCETNSCEFMIVLGDNIYPDGADGSDKDAKRLMDILVTPYLEVGRGEENFLFYAALGNHDWKSSRKGRDVQIEFASSGKTRYIMEDPGFYTFTRGDAQFWVLDTEMLLADSVVYKDKLDSNGHEILNDELDPAPTWAKPQTPEEYAQLQWLAKGMAESKARWKIVYGHHTLWSAGGTKYGEAHALRPQLLPILCRYADAWFNGHEHDLGVFSDSCQSVLGYEKPLPIIVSGAGAKQRAINEGFAAFQEETYPSYEGHWMKGMTWGFAHVELFAEHGRVTMITTPDDQSGTPVEAYTHLLKRRSETALSGR